jgi:uncharacterized membrane protein
MEPRNPENFHAVLTPHRSLTRQGFIALMTVVIAINFAAGSIFTLMGAWPVAPFAGLDVLLIWWAFKRNFADGRRAEHIEITPHELILERFVHGKAAGRQRFVRPWVRVELAEDRERELIGGLFLRSHGKRTEIGRFLAPDERKSLAQALNAALATPRVPRP